MEQIIEREVPEARLIVSDYGDKRGVEGADTPGGYQGTVRVELVPRDQRDRGQFEITAATLLALQDVPGADIREVRENPLNPDGNDGLVINVYGFDMTLKKELTDGIQESLMRTEGIVGATSSSDAGRPELQVVYGSRAYFKVEYDHLTGGQCRERRCTGSNCHNLCRAGG